MSKAQEKDQVAFDTPARIRPEHYITNPEAPVALQRWAIKDDSPLGKAYENGKLGSGGRRGYTAEDRYKAAVIYRGLWDTIHSSGSQSKFDRVGGSGSPPAMRAQEALCTARRQKKDIEARMSSDNAFLVRCFVGEGSSGSDAVKARIEGFEKAVWLALCLALDNLIDAVVGIGLRPARD